MKLRDLFFGKRQKEITVTPPAPGRYASLRRHTPRLGLGKRGLFSDLDSEYDGASQNRYGEQWRSQPLTADQILQNNQVTLVARSQEQIRNNDYARQYLRLSVSNVVGHAGVTLQAKAKTGDKLDKDLNNAILAAWNDWCAAENCDVTGQKSFRLMQKDAIRKTVGMGEFLFRVVFGTQYGGKFGFALQAINPQKLPMLMKVDNMPDGHFIRFGIEFNSYGRPVAYYFPDQDQTSDYLNWGGVDYTRIPAEEIIHGFDDEIGGQRRGLPWLATSLFRSRQLVAMESAALVNARTGANKQGFIEQDKETENPLLDWDAEDDGDFEIESEPGEMTILPAGATFKEYNPQYPNGEYVGFKKSHLQGIASGYGISYNNLCNDLEGVNFSSIRQGTLNERDNWKEVQEWFIESFIEKVYKLWLPRALLGGFIKLKGRPVSATRLDDLMVVEWQARRWDWIDPEKDVNANIIAIKNGLTSQSRVIREKGLDPDAIWQERAEETKKQIDMYIAQGMSKENAENLVLLASGMDAKIIVEKLADEAAQLTSANNRE